MDSKFIGISVLFLLGFAIFSGYVFFSGSLNVATRATNQSNIVSPTSSLIFAWPLSVPADSQTQSEVSVFVRNQDNKGINGKIVTLQTPSLLFQPQTSETDTDGRAIFKIASGTVGVAEIEAIVDNVAIAQKVSVEFK